MDGTLMNSKKALAAAIALIIAGASLPAHSEVKLHTFQPGERASAADVNGNFRNLKVAVEASERRIVELTSRIRDLEAAISTVRALNGVLSIEQVNGVRTVRLTGVNLQVVNGTNFTETVNGAGNVIIGYDEQNRTINRPVCSTASARNGAPITSEAACLTSGGVFSAQHKTGSHNLVLGTQNNYSSYSGIVAGRGNFINERYASVLGGAANAASGTFSVIVAGAENRTLAPSGAILGGGANEVSAQNGTVSGGGGNRAMGALSSVSGGTQNRASGDVSSVSGGRFNTAAGTSSSVTGGANQTVSVANGRN